MCGGDQANYGGPGLRPIGEACKACPMNVGGGYSFLYSGQDQVFTPRVVAAAAATSETDCFGEFVQMSINAWNLDMQQPPDWGVSPVTVDSFDLCVQMCQYDTSCQFLQYDYTKSQDNCQLKVQVSVTGR